MENNDKNRAEELENVKEQDNVVFFEEQKSVNTPENREEVSSSVGEQLNSDTVSVDAFPSSSGDMILGDTKSTDSVEKKETDEQIGEHNDEGDIGISKKRTVMSVLRIVLIIIFFCVFAVSVFMIGSNVIQGYLANDIYNEMSNDFFEGMDRTGFMDYLAPAVIDSSMPKYDATRKLEGGGDYRIIDTNNQFFEQFKKKLIQYMEINPDIYGWIQVDGTNISYACVKGTNNFYYLDHTATLESNVNGAIFADYRCSFDVVKNPNLVFYGHNMIYPSQMFNELTKYLDANFFENNKYVTIYTLDGVYRFEIFSIYETDTKYHYCQLAFNSNEVFVNWCYEMKSKSLHQRNISDFTPESRILTLSTCTNGAQSRRYSLQAKLVMIEK